MKVKGNKKGFTLVECVVSIFIIVIITTIAITAYMSASSSLVSQWDSFLVSQLADDILACFEGSDDMSTFASRLNLAQLGESTSGNVEQTVSGDGLEYDPSEAMTPIDFSKIRANESGSVTFLDSSGNSLTTLDYGSNNSLYQKDVDYLKNSGLYSSKATNGTTTVKDTVYTIGYYYKSDTSNSNYKKRNFKVTYDGTNTTFTNLNGTSKSVATNDFEKYLRDNGWYISPSSTSYSTAQSGGGYVQFTTWDMDNNAVKDSSGNQLYFQVNFASCSIDNISSVGDAWSTATVTYGTDYISYRYGTSGTWHTLKDSNNKSMTAKNWGTFMYISIYAANTSSTKNHYFKNEITQKTVDAGLEYTDYTLKSGHNSVLLYVLTDGSNMSFYNNEELIYKYSGRNTALTKSLSSLPTAFTCVRAYTNGVVTFCNGDTPIFSYQYDSTENFNNDVAKSLKNTELYTQGDTKNSQQTKVQITAGPQVNWSSTETRAAVTYYVDNVKGKTRLYVYEDTESNTARTKTYEKTSSLLEKALAEKGLILYFDENSSDKDNRKMYFYVLDAATGKPKTDANGNNMYIRLTYSADSDTTGRWNTTSTSNTNYMCFNITNVDYAYSGASDIATLRSNGASFTSYGVKQSFSWGSGFISYAYIVANNIKSTNHVYKYKTISTYYNLSEYTVYNLNVADKTISDFSEGTNGYVLYNADKVEVYKNTESKLTPSNDSSGIIDLQIKGVLGFTDTSDDTELEGVTKYYKKLGIQDITKYIVNDTKKTISFCDSYNTEIVIFEYTDDALYQQDKNDLTSSGGAFSQYYSGTSLSEAYRGKPLLRKGSDAGGNVFFQMIIKSGENYETENTVFVSYTTKIKVRASSITNDFQPIKSEETVLRGNWETRLYTYTINNYSLVAKVTYSQYAGDVSHEPSLKIWLMTKLNCEDWKTRCTSGDLQDKTIDEKVAVLGDTFIDYRKG